MNKIRKQIEHLVLLFASLILLQSCVVYKKTPVSLEQAAATKHKVKIVTKENEKQKYLYVTTINEEYYGIIKVDGKLAKIPLQEENLEIVRMEDKVKSFLYSILLIIPISIVAIVIGTLLAGDAGGI